MLSQAFTCRVCGYEGLPIHGIETDSIDLSDERQFVGCDSCGARHQVCLLPEGGCRFEILEVYPEDRALPG